MVKHDRKQRRKQFHTLTKKKRKGKQLKRNNINMGILQGESGKKTKARGLSIPARPRPDDIVY